MAQSQIAQVEVEVGNRPAWPLQTSIGHIQPANLQRRHRGERRKELIQRFGALQTNFIQAQVINQPATVGVAFGVAGQRAARDIGAKGA